MCACVSVYMYVYKYVCNYSHNTHICVCIEVNKRMLLPLKKYRAFHGTFERVELAKHSVFCDSDLKHFTYWGKIYRGSVAVRRKLSPDLLHFHMYFSIDTHFQFKVPYFPGNC